MLVTVRSRLIAIILLPLLALLFVTLYARENMSDSVQGVSTIYDDRVVPLQQLKIIADAYAVFIIDAVNKANAGRFTGQQALSDVIEARQTIAEQWTAYKVTKLTAEEAQLVREADILFADTTILLDKLEAELKANSGAVAGQLGAFDGPLYEVIDPISSKITELIDLQLHVAAAERKKITDAYSEDQLVFWLVTLCCIAFASALGWWVYHAIRTPLMELRHVLLRVRELDLRTTVANPSNDEIGETAQACNVMIIEFRQVLATLTGMAQQLSGMASALDHATADARQCVESQQSEAEQVATAATEMSSTVAEVARNADTAASYTREVSKSVQVGRATLDQVSHSMSRLGDTIGLSNQVIGNLNAHCNEIGSMLDIIKNIAEQTNLLALNAAIEAARAGEQGRGFAVVADEVRALAQRTQLSTKEIAAVIENLQGGARDAGDKMQLSKQSADEAVALTHTANNSFDSIHSAMKQIGDMNIQIAAATEEQSAVSEGVAKNVVRIRDLGLETGTKTEQSYRIGANLKQITESVYDTVARFKV